MWAWISLIAVAAMLIGVVWSSDRSSRAVFAGSLLINAMLLGAELGKVSP